MKTEPAAASSEGHFGTRALMLRACRFSDQDADFFKDLKYSCPR